MAGSLGVTETARTEDSTLLAGDFHAIKAATVKSGEGALVRGAVLARDEASDKYVELDIETAIADEVLGTGSKTATAVTAEALVTDAGGALTEFAVFAANGDIEPGSVTIDATVGAAGKEATDANSDGKITGDSGNISGFVDYASGFIYLKFATAPDDNTNITADYTHGEDTKVFAATLAQRPVIPRTVTVSATIAAATVTATDDGHGKITGTGVTGTIDYDTGAVSVTYTTAPDDAEDVEVDYSYGDAAQKNVAVGILRGAVDATSADATAQVHVVGEYRTADLVWPSSITAGNKARALEQLQAQGIIVK